MRLLALILLAGTPALAALPQAEREQNVYRYKAARREAIFRAQYPSPVIQVPQTQINVYAPSYGYPGYVSPAFGGYGRPAWAPSW
jgi:hypothetical protein